MSAFNAKQIRQAETEVLQLEMDMLWHLHAKRHRGFTNYDGLMSQETLTAAKERHRSLRTFIHESRKKAKTNGK